MVAKFVEKYDDQVHRFLEMVPGILTWVLLLSPIWAGLLAPKLIIFYITFLTVYWFYLALRHTLGAMVGLRRYNSEMKVDWADKLEDLDFSQLPDQKTLPTSLDKTKFFLLVPVFSEPKGVIRDMLHSIATQTFGTERVTMVFGVEEKYADREIEFIKEVISEIDGKFEDVLIYVHPAGIPGEAIGVAGANRTWGARHAVEDITKKGKNIRDYIFLTIDCDHVLDKQFLARLAYLYLTSDKRDNKFYSTALHLFNNNIWEVPFMMRAEANFVTLGGLSDSVVTPPVLKDTFACYGSSLKTLVDANYWDVKFGIDDTLFFWRAFFARDGDFVGAYHYIPYSADAVQADTAAKSHISLYKQLLRWGWGVISFPISFKEFLKNKKVPLGIKLLWTFKHLEMKIFMISIVFLMTFGIPIVTAINPVARQTIFAYSLPNIMSVILTVAMILIIPTTYLRFKLLKPIPKSWSIWRKVLVYFESLLILVNLLTYSFIPFVDAQTRLLLGKKMKDLYHTPKIRST